LEEEITMAKKRKKYTPEQKIQIIKKHPVDRVPLSDLKKDKKLLFQCVSTENCELCTGISCSPTY
jgi:hypothetical protein